jgi:hypothetical protein
MQDYPGISSDEWLCFVDVINHGRRPVGISSLPGLRFKDGSRFVMSPFPGTNPAPLTEGSKVRYWMYEAKLVEGLLDAGDIPRWVQVDDDTGQQHIRRIPLKTIKYLTGIRDKHAEEKDQTT